MATSTTATSGGTSALAPYLELKRLGNTFTAYSSANGSTYTLIGSVTRADMPNALQLGLSLDAFGASGSGVYDNVLVVALPEPGSCALVLCAGAWLCRRRPKRLERGGHQ